MILDNELVFSKGQSITGTAVSTNAINAKAAGVGAGRQVPVYLVVDEDFNNLTSLDFELQESSDDGSSDAYSAVLSKSIVLANLKAGNRLYLFDIPPGTEQYLRMNYVVTGSNPSAGKVSTGLVLDLQTA